MATISLRRTKDKALIGLPPKTTETCYVELSAEERELYDRMEGEAKSVLRNYIDTGSMMRNYSTVLSIILRLRQICTDSALCPSDLKSLLPSNNIEGTGKGFYFSASDVLIFGFNFTSLVLSITLNSYLSLQFFQWFPLGKVTV